MVVVTKLLLAAKHLGYRTDSHLLILWYFNPTPIRDDLVLISATISQPAPVQRLQNTD